MGDVVTEGEMVRHMTEAEHEEMALRAGIELLRVNLEDNVQSPLGSRGGIRTLQTTEHRKINGLEAQRVGCQALSLRHLFLSKKLK
ncbi:hypothetical protein [Aestuariivirga sp.]|uniref:hypothetical protein n=1 Tax=Aestuariivirga sp. TaxID=2650926 RepID=UPI0030169A08